MRKRLEALKNDQKGFTLVELIVVLVILAIMAALLVPALLGYVDRAKEGRYLEEARSIYTAVQAVNDEKYATDTVYSQGYVAADSGLNSATVKDKINKLVAPTAVKTFSAVSYGSAASSGTTKANYSVQSLTVNFKSQDGTDVTAALANGSWTVTIGSGS